MKKLSLNYSSIELKDSNKNSCNLVSNDFPSSSNSTNNREQMVRKNRKLSWASFKTKSLKVAGLSNSRNRAITLTLFGVVAIFFICHFPAVITKIIYVVFPAIEFENKSVIASIILDISNFLIMLNSSINFILYIVFGPGKFREEFSIIFFTIFSSCFRVFRFRKIEGSVTSEATSQSKLGFMNRRKSSNNSKNFYDNRINKTSIQSISECNINSVASTPMLDLTCETLDDIDKK
jgi:hypothetical protein